MTGGLWAVISGIVVMQATWSETESSASLRVLGSLIGAVIAAVFLSFLPFSVIGMAVCIALTVIVCQLFGIPSHARLASITVAVVMVFSVLSPEITPVINAALRFIEVVIGATVAVLVSRFWPFGRREG